MCKEIEENKHTEVDETELQSCVEEEEPVPITGWDTESDGFWL